MFYQAAVAVVVAFAPVQAEQLVGRWEGVLALPDGQFLPVVLRVSKDADGKISALADAPSMNDMNRPVANLTLENGLIRFELTGQGRYEGQVSGDTIDGNWIEGDGALPLKLMRVPA